jgi:hypothetical protein
MFFQIARETILLLINNIYMKKLCSHMRAQVTCEIVNFNINTFNRKSTKNTSHFCHALVNVWVFLLFSTI